MQQTGTKRVLVHPPAEGWCGCGQSKSAQSNPGVVQDYVRKHDKVEQMRERFAKASADIAQTKQDIHDLAAKKLGPGAGKFLASGEYRRLAESAYELGQRVGADQFGIKRTPFLEWLEESNAKRLNIVNKRLLWVLYKQGAWRSKHSKKAGFGQHVEELATETSRYGSGDRPWKGHRGEKDHVHNPDRYTDWGFIDSNTGRVILPKSGDRLHNDIARRIGFKDWESAVRKDKIRWWWTENQAGYELPQNKKAAEAAYRHLHNAPRAFRFVTVDVWPKKGQPTSRVYWGEEAERALRGVARTSNPTNPAVSGPQYRLAQAVLAGKSSKMPVSVAREFVDRTSTADRSKWAHKNGDIDVTFVIHRDVIYTCNGERVSYLVKPAMVLDRQVYVDGSFSKLEDAEDAAVEAVNTAMKDWNGSIRVKFVDHDLVNGQKGNVAA